MEWKSNARTGSALEEGTIFDNQYGVCIHRIIHCHGWYLSCSKLGVSDYHLHAESFDDAVEEAKEVVRSTVNDLLTRFRPFTEDASQNELVKWFSRQV